VINSDFHVCGDVSTDGALTIDGATLRISGTLHLQAGADVQLVNGGKLVISDHCAETVAVRVPQNKKKIGSRG
jgi:hypothetical protein